MSTPLRILHFADLHLDARFAWVPRPFASVRRQALRDTLCTIVDLARTERVDAVLCSGDLFEHDRVTPDTAKFLRSQFEALHPIPVYVAPGNHDHLARESLYALVTWSPNVHVFDSDELEPTALVDGVTMWGAAHLVPASTRGFLDSFRVDRSGINLAVFHGSEQSWLPYQGADKQPHAPFRADQIERAGLDFAFVGHYHSPRRTDRLAYPGNPDPLSFGECGDRGAILATISPDGAVAMETRTVAASRVHDIVVDVTGCTSFQEIRDQAASVLTGVEGAIRLTVQGELHPDVEPQYDLLRALVLPPSYATVHQGDLRQGYDLEAIAAEPTVRGQFVRDVRASELDADIQRKVLVTGLRALSGRRDLEAS